MFSCPHVNHRSTRNNTQNAGKGHERTREKRRYETNFDEWRNRYNNSNGSGFEVTEKTKDSRKEEKEESLYDF